MKWNISRDLIGRFVKLDFSSYVRIFDSIKVRVMSSKVYFLLTESIWDKLGLISIRLHFISELFKFSIPSLVYISGKLIYLSIIFKKGSDFPMTWGYFIKYYVLFVKARCSGGNNSNKLFSNFTFVLDIDFWMNRVNKDGSFDINFIVYLEKSSNVKFGNGFVFNIIETSKYSAGNCRGEGGILNDLDVIENGLEECDKYFKSFVRSSLYSFYQLYFNIFKGTESDYMEWRKSVLSSQEYMDFVVYFNKSLSL